MIPHNILLYNAITCICSTQVRPSRTMCVTSLNTTKGASALGRFEIDRDVSVSSHFFSHPKQQKHLVCLILNLLQIPDLISLFHSTSITFGYNLINT
ncbi:MAG: hypothetical protein V1773_05090 [bacterium]